MTSTVHVDAVSVAYGRTCALSAVSVEIRPGDIICLAGRNGAGKSTLLRAIAGLEPRVTGSVRVDDQPASSAHAKRKVAMLTNPPPLYPYLTARSTPRCCATCGSCRRRRPTRCSWRTTSRHLAGKTPEEMSLGQRQRLAFALLDLPRPEVWLLDEPFNGLDADAGAALLERLRAQQAAGRSAVVATHLIEVIEPVATRLLWLSDGTIVCDEPIETSLAERCEALIATRAGAPA